MDGSAAKCLVARDETSAYEGLVRTPESDEEVIEVTKIGKTNFGDATATCHEGLKGGFGTRETSNFILVTVGHGSGLIAVSTIDGRPSGVLRGVLTGYALLEVVAGGLTVSAEEGDTTKTNTLESKPESDALDEESVVRKVKR